MASNRKAIGDLLVDNGQITPEELEQAEAEREKTGEPIASVLSKLGFVTEGSLKNALELQYGVNYVNLSTRDPEQDLVSLLPEATIREQLAVPLSQQGERLTIAMVDPSDSAALDDVKRKLNGRQVKTVVCLEEEFLKFVNKAFGVEEKTTNGADGSAGHASDTAQSTSEASQQASQASQASQAPQELPQEARQAPVQPPIQATETVKKEPITSKDEPEMYSTQEMRARPAPSSFPSETREEPQKEPGSSESLSELDLAKKAQEEAIVLLANQILGSAIKRHCSNIHISMGNRESIVHYRLNGRLVVDRKLPNAVVTALVARYKMMARLNLAERKEPQDGHIKVKSASKEIVCLISVVPTDHGESVVIWIV